MLIDDNKKQRLLSHIKNSRATHNIIVLTNDFSDIEASFQSLIDVQIVLDTSRSHSEEYGNVVRNLAEQGLRYLIELIRDSFSVAVETPLEFFLANILIFIVMSTLG